MTDLIPPIDAHAHVETDIHPQALLALRAVVLVALRSQSEFDQAAERKDPLAVWGVGIHPGVATAIDNFDADDLRSQLRRTPLLSEVGLDRRSSAPTKKQEDVFRAALSVHDEAACVASIHSAGRTARVLEMIQDHRCSTMILHWWNGSADETQRAVELGCYFSVNERSLDSPNVSGIPIERMLTETDHPYGDLGRNARPGRVDPVESAFGRSPAEFRRQTWQNFGRLFDNADAAYRLPSKVRGLLAASTPGSGKHLDSSVQ